MYRLASPHAQEFIDHHEIMESIDYAQRHCQEEALLERILEKAAARQGLSHREALLLLETDHPKIENKIFALAKTIKEAIYGRRIVLFAPLYLSNHCVNTCTYCPYHRQNTTMQRKKLNQEEIEQQVIALQDMGHKRLALETGEDPVNVPIEYLLESIETIYRVRHKNGAIRRVNVNIAATSEENYRKLKEAQIGTYLLFQETYHQDTYEALHPSGPKHNYPYHTQAMDRAMRAGLDDVGIGVLFGLYEYRYDFTALLMHAEHLEAAFGVGPHTLSVPRIRPATDVSLESFPHAIPDALFKKIVAVLRISVPYAGMIVSTRESANSRQEVLRVGVSQISGASCTSVGGYGAQEEGSQDTAQFDLEDTRSLEEIVHWLLELGYVPSFCTACYRQGRTGDRFMHLAKTGNISQVCQPNSLLTLKEYLLDYANLSTKKLGERVIAEAIESIGSPQVADLTRQCLSKMDKGQRDFLF